MASFVWIKKLALGMSLLMLAVNAASTDLNPASEQLRLRVSSIALDGFSSIDEQAISVQELRQRVQQERAQFPERMSVDEIHRVAEALTVFIRQKGYVFHTVYLPAQKVNGDVVKLILQEGVLADVHVANQTDIKSRRFERVFDALIGKLLYGPEVEERVQALKAQTGFSVFAFYSRGKRPGEARLNLRVSPEDKRNLALRVDNYGSATSGERRLIAQFTEHQFTGRFDRLSLAVLYALDGVSNTYGSLYYSLPSGTLNNVWEFSASNNQFELGERYKALGLEGDTRSLRIGLNRILDHKPLARHGFRVSLYSKESQLSNAQASIEDESSQAANVEWYKSRRFAKSPWFMNSNLSLTYGRAENGASINFTKVEFGLFTTRSFASGRLQNLAEVNLKGQYSDINMPSIEGFALTGAYGVRGFEAGLFSSDRALLSSIEIRFPNLLSNSERLRPELFLLADWASGTRLETSVNGSLQPKSQASFSSAGIGLRVNWKKRLSMQLTAASPLHSDIEGTQVDENAIWLFEARWQ